MNQAFYDKFKKNESIKIGRIKNYIKNNSNEIASKLKKVIAELNSKREQEVLTLKSDLSYQNRYHGAVLSTNESIWTDFDKSIEYEAILSAVLEFIDV